MTITEQHQILIEPVISYPREARVGKSYLMTIDLRLATPNQVWPYEDEEFPVWFLLDTMPLFSYEPLSESDASVVLHRFGGTYGPARFLLTAAQEVMSGKLHVTLINRWGSPIAHVPLESEIKLEEVSRPFVVQRDLTYGIELVLTFLSNTLIKVSCNRHLSHTFDLHTLVPDEKTGPPQPLTDPVTYGKAVYQALFPVGSAARAALDNAPERIMLVTTDATIDSVPWEYAYGSFGAGDADSFLVIECHFVRGLPAVERIAPPTLDSGLHIVAIPSNPLHKALAPLNIDGEWLRLKEIIQQVPFAITLERARPPTMEQVCNLVANQHPGVLHFMGHGGQDETSAVLCFEKENGDLDIVRAKEFLQHVHGTIFLVTLNACVSATPGETHFSNLAAALVRQKTPYALGMRFGITDDDARTFSSSFYYELVRGSSVEEALFQARLKLARSSHGWSIGVPMLYTALAEFRNGFGYIPGTPTIIEHQPPVEATAIPRAEGVFQGRIDELKLLGTYLTDEHHPRIVTIHGSGGQGKTALAREAVERFAHAWPGGVWATTLESLPGKEVFVNGLANFLGIITQDITDPNELERQVLYKLHQQRTLIVLDNADTLVEAVEKNNDAAISLMHFIRERLLGPMVSLLVTSRDYLGVDGEVGLDLEGLTPEDGASLFRHSALQRVDESDLALATQLSRKVDGHPLSLRLLGGAFNLSSVSLSDFVQDCETYLLAAENKYLGPDHRHRSLYACIETSVRYLDEAHRRLFSNLWLFHAPFMPEIAATIFDPEHKDDDEALSSVYDQLNSLWQRGLLVRETSTIREGTLLFYRLLPTMRLYIEKYLEQVDEPLKLLEQFGEAYAQLLRYLYNELNFGGIASFLALQLREDLERGAVYVTGTARGYYLLRWGWILQRLGDTRHGLKLTEQALEIGQSQDHPLELQALNNIAGVYNTLGQPQRALELYEQALPLRREVGDRAGEAATLNNIAGVYNALGQPQRALELYEQALPLMREVGDRASEATTLNNIAGVYNALGQPQRALELYEQALPLMREFGDRAGEAATLNNIALVYNTLGQPQRALELYEQALPLRREVGDRTGEAATLHNIAEVYRALGQPQRALELYEQALPLRREVGDRTGEAATLHNIAGVYNALGQPQRALELYEQALPLRREVGDRTGEAATLHNIALVYRALGQPQHALELYEQALLLMRQVGDRAGEATALHNIALVYNTLGQPQHALELYEQALLLMRQVGDHAGEATALNGLGYIFMEMLQYPEALAVFEQSAIIAQQILYVAAEIAGLLGMALVLYQHLNRPQEAVTKMEQAITVMVETGLPRDAGGTSLEMLQQYLNAMRQGASLHNLATMSLEQLRPIIANTIAVMTTMQDRQDEWRETLTKALQDAQQRGDDWQIEVDFFTTVLTILDGRSPDLPGDHPYAQALAAIQDGIAKGGVQDEDTWFIGNADEVVRAIIDFVNAGNREATRQVLEARQAILFRPEVETLFEQNIAQVRGSGNQRAAELLEMHLELLRASKANGIAEAFAQLATTQEVDLPFDVELIPRSVHALLGGPQEKMEHVQYLAALAAQTQDEELKALISTIQLALFSGELSKLGEQLSGAYRQAWEIIMTNIGTGSIEPVSIIIHKLALNRYTEWSNELINKPYITPVKGERDVPSLSSEIITMLDKELKKSYGTLPLWTTLSTEPDLKRAVP